MRVELDGEPFVACPGEAERYVEAGTHQLVAVKPGHLTLKKDLVLLGGKRVRERIALASLDDVGRTVPRWARWKPWAVVGAGAAIALVGVPLQLASRSNFESFDRQVASECPGGCPFQNLSEPARKLHDRAELQNTIAVSAFIAGGVTVAAGVTLVVLNRKRKIGREAARLSAVPLPGGAAIGVFTSW